jgi:sterol 3beta-glucosyltransferase
MHIAILTTGSRGDVQPYVALGVGLQAAGHTVTIVTGASFTPLITEHGLQHAPLQPDLMALLATPEGRAAIAGRNPLGAIKKVRPLLRTMLDQCWTATAGADGIVYNPKALAGYHIAEKRGLPAVLAHPVPTFSPTAAFAVPAISLPNMGGTLNRLSYAVFLRAATASVRGIVNAWRTNELGLAPVQNEYVRDGQPVPTLYGCSPAIVPPPTDWPTTTVMTGGWLLDAPAWEPPTDLLAFLDAGPPPIYIGFGSMVGQDSAKLTVLVLDALRHADLRAVLATGVGALNPANGRDTYILDAAPHTWLFPRMAAIVHHGGAGTTAAAAHAGKPQIICPFFGDQPFWGRRIAALGAGLPPLPQKRLTVQQFAAALHHVHTDEQMRQRAAALGVRVRAENGVGHAVQHIDALLQRG